MKLCTVGTSPSLAVGIVQIINYLPYFQMDCERFHQTTIRQALSHASGMSNLDEIE